jgi:2'-5' RNA ligase
MNTVYQMPGYRINEYRLDIPLSTSLQEKIHSLRQRLHEKHRIKFPFELKPSLTILRFHAFERMEAKILERFQQVALARHPFKVELQDFSAYPTHTIYIDVLTKIPFNDLARELKKHKWMMNIPEHQPHFINEPHLIIAQRLKPKEFVNLWLECEHSQFPGRYMADSMFLLRRSALSKRYEVARRMEFMSLPIQIKQGALFGEG